MRNYLKALVFATAAMLVAGCEGGSQPTSPSESTTPVAGSRAVATGITIISLGTLGGSSSVAQGINDNGQIVGYSTTAGGAQHAFVWQNNVFTDLGVLAGAAGSFAYDINEAGVVVGQSGLRPVRWLPNANGGYGAAQDLGSLGGCCGDAQAVNDGGQITGSSAHLIPNPSPTAPDTAWHAYVWQSGVMTDIHSLAERDQTFTWGMNNGGSVVGQDFQPGRPFVRPPGGPMQFLQGIGGPNGVALDINEAGAVVGWSQVLPTSQALHATLWVNGTAQDLGTLGGPSSVAIAINDATPMRIVGRADALHGQHAFVWTATGPSQGMKDLGLPKGGSFGQAWDINSHGWIVGETSGQGGRTTRATLWKLPAP